MAGFAYVVAFLLSHVAIRASCLLVDSMTALPKTEYDFVIVGGKDPLFPDLSRALLRIKQEETQAPSSRIG
jgi:hypothetical protein